jgi:hypothetical protein
MSQGICLVYFMTEGRHIDIPKTINAFHTVVVYPTADQSHLVKLIANIDNYASRTCVVCGETLAEVHSLLSQLHNALNGCSFITAGIFNQQIEGFDTYAQSWTETFQLMFCNNNRYQFPGEPPVSGFWMQEVLPIVLVKAAKRMTAMLMLAEFSRHEKARSKLIAEAPTEALVLNSNFVPSEIHATAFNGAFDSIEWVKEMRGQRRRISEGRIRLSEFLPDGSQVRQKAQVMFDAWLKNRPMYYVESQSKSQSMKGEK